MTKVTKGDREEKCRGCGRDLIGLNWYQAKKHIIACVNQNGLEPFMEGRRGNLE